MRRHVSALREPTGRPASVASAAGSGKDLFTIKDIGEGLLRIPLGVGGRVNL